MIMLGEQVIEDFPSTYLRSMWLHSSCDHGNDAVSTEGTLLSQYNEGI